MSSCKLAPVSSLFLSTPFLSSPSSITLKKKLECFMNYTNFLHELQSCWFLLSFLYNIEMRQQKSIQACKILSFLKPKLHGFYDHVRNRQWQVYCFLVRQETQYELDSCWIEMGFWVWNPIWPPLFFFSDAIFMILSRELRKHGLLAPLWLNLTNNLNGD